MIYLVNAERVEVHPDFRPNNVAVNNIAIIRVIFLRKISTSYY